MHVHILLSSDPRVLTQDSTAGGNTDWSQYISQHSQFVQYARDILSGDSYKVARDILSKRSIFLQIDDPKLGSAGLIDRLKGHFQQWMALENQSEVLLFLAISLLQTFLQNNFTGPLVETDLLFGDGLIVHPETVSRTLINRWFIQSLVVEGQPAYELVTNPEYLVCSLLILEQLTAQPSLFQPPNDSGSDKVDPIESIDIGLSQTTLPSLAAVAHWWRARALLAQLSLVPEPLGYQATVASKILSTPGIVNNILGENLASDKLLRRKLLTVYYMEHVKTLLAVKTEHLCLDPLIKLKELTEFEFVLTGARARRTKYQQTPHSGLIILARSEWNTDTEAATGTATEATEPESLSLNSDLLLEQPVFESIGSEPLDEQLVKRQKLDGENIDGLEEHRLLPVAIRQEYIPRGLQLLDPNRQPLLSNYDSIQLLLRLYVLRQTTPARDPLVEEELTALISRVIYQGDNSSEDGSMTTTRNWSVFSRSLWERSILETRKVKTIERGLLQMQSLVEELGLQITTRLIPQQAEVSEKSDNLTHLSPAAPRLKYIHQLPFIPRWELDATLAEKYMEMGLLKSAVEIYERLHMWCEVALCYAAVGDEKLATDVLMKYLEANPEDARAYSILGDIKQDPTLWERSWELGKYVNAKNSLARYYYSPPESSGLKRDLGLVLRHLNDSLTRYPLSFDTWYFYGCVGLECGKFDIAAEAFSRCVSLDETHALSWSNLAAAYTQQDKLTEAFSCLKRAVASDSQKNWRIWENYMTVAVKLNEWLDVLTACKQLININRDKEGEGTVDLPIVEKLVEILVSSGYPTDESDLTFFQRSCIEFLCGTLPGVITHNVRLWQLVARVELWRKKPWASLDCHERAYRAAIHNPDLEVDEASWNNAVEACADLVAAYESLGEMEGKYGPGSVVCKDWKYKARSTVKSLMSKCKRRWESTEGWERLMELRQQI